MRKLWFVLALCAALLMTSAALADKPAGGVRPRVFNPNAPTPRTEYALVPDSYTYEAGETVVLTATIPEGGYYDFSLTVLDGSYEQEYMADTLRFFYGLTEETYSFDMVWIPGSYVVFYDIYGPAEGEDEEAPLAVSSYFLFEVTECSGANELYSRVQQAAAACRGANEFETVVNIHNWVVNHCEYDYTYTYYSAESLFFLGTGVCNSYSRAFNLLTEAAGIGTRRVLGWAGVISDDTGHAWNAACIDGKWHLYDCTWDDTGNDGYFAYRYCGLPSDLMNLDDDHIVEYIPGGAVSCTSLDSNYFVRTGRWRDECGDAADEMEARLAEGKHRMTVQTGVEFGSDSDAETYILNRIAAAGISATVWTDALGIDCMGVFTVTRGSSDITGAMIGSGWLTLPEETQIIGAEAFTGCEANYVILPDACTTVGGAAFGYSLLWEIRMSENVTDIADDAFAGLPSVLIIAPAGSYAANWALDHGCETAVE